MMVIDGVTGSLRDGARAVHLDVAVELTEPGRPPEALHLADGDGMCMGYHAWLDGDFGKDPLTRP